jgi:hypothetical protein
MSGILHLNLIHFLDFYFAFMFFIGTVRRFGQYWNIMELVILGPTRWSRLLQLITEHRVIFLTWSTLIPALMALGLSLLQLLASRAIWPEAGRPPEGLTIERLLEHPWALVVVVPLSLAMFGMDLYSLYLVASVDRRLMEKYFDQAEYWLRSHTAYVVRFVTIGYVDPRKMVDEEVRKALETVRELLNFTLWWVAIQVGLRFSCGLSLWLTWALSSSTP